MKEDRKRKQIRKWKKGKGAGGQEKENRVGSGKKGKNAGGWKR